MYIFAQCSFDHSWRLWDLEQLKEVLHQVSSTCLFGMTRDAAAHTSTFNPFNPKLIMHILVTIQEEID